MNIERITLMKQFEAETAKLNNHLHDQNGWPIAAPEPNPEPTDDDTPTDT